ncbi:MAG TPA: hypothetical protein DCR93_03780, partial [Cytophagales bacterium]|nr:hypothetical protein [Cytophagales bacterium]
ITAAGESVSDYIIWGSYPGQNYITFDGITLFSSWGINQEFGRVNPALVKNVEVYKGGYQVPYGDRIGGVVMMEGREGNRQRQEADLQLTNQMASGYVNVPLFQQKASLQLAARSTFAQTWQPFSDLQNTQVGDVFTKSNYRDVNVKLSADLSPRDRLVFSFLGSGDFYAATFDRRRRDTNSDNSVQLVTSSQVGSSLRYTRTWGKGGLTQVLASQSRYLPTRTLSAFFLEGEMRADRFQTQWSNTIDEQRVSVTHTLPSRGGHQLSAEVGFIGQASKVDTETPGRVRERPDQFEGRVSGYLLDAIQIMPGWSLDLGLKADVVPRRDTVFLQPRLTTTYSLSDQWRFNAAWGYYNQFLALTPYTDAVGNQTEVWRVADGAPIQPQFAEHRVVGVSWYAPALQVTVEGFHKRFSSLGQFQERNSDRPEFAPGRGRAR